jgi:hypothetical protein
LALETVEFLNHIKRHNSAYTDLLFELNYLSTPVDDETGPQLYVRAHHFDAVIRVLKLQINLPINAIGLLRSYLEHNDSNIHMIIRDLRREFLPKISQQAYELNYAHHSLIHAVEMKNCAIPVITKDLGIFASEDDKLDIFMRDTISVAIENHDRIQGDPGKYPSVEQATAALVTQWITGMHKEERNFPDFICQIIEYVVEYIITISTTMIFSKTDAMDLSELFLLIQNAAFESGLGSIHETNKEFFLQVRTSSLIVATCDTVPCSIIPAVRRQAETQRTNSINHLALYHVAKPHTSIGSVIKHFFENELLNFVHYSADFSKEISQQAFLRGKIPKIGMLIELSRNDLQNCGHAKSLGSFIRFCQNQYVESDSFNEFIDVYEENFTAEIVTALKELFLNREKINHEKNFCLSQVEKIKKIAEEVRSYQEKYGNFGEIINHDTPSIDADNLEGFFVFYEALNEASKLRLIKEVALNMVMQAGLIYVTVPSLEEVTAEYDFLIETPRDFSVTEGANLKPATISIDSDTGLRPYLLHSISSIFTQNPAISLTSISREDSAVNNL